MIIHPDNRRIIRHKIGFANAGEQFVIEITKSVEHLVDAIGSEISCCSDTAEEFASGERDQEPGS